MNENPDVRLDKLEAENRELRVVLSGDLSGRPGVLQNQIRMITALFDQTEGVVPRLTAMERRELERMGWLKGAYFVWAILGTVLGVLIKTYLK